MHNLYPTVDELHSALYAAYGKWGRGIRQGENPYKGFYPFWPFLIRTGLVKFRGGSVCLTHRGRAVRQNTPKLLRVIARAQKGQPRA